MSGTQADRLRDLAVRSNDGNLAGPALGAADTIDAKAARIEALQAERNAAVLAEREECARVVAAAGIRVYEANKKEFPSHAAEAFDFGEEVADAIRALSDKEPGQ